MNKQQKEALQEQLNSEKRTLNELKQVYQQAIKDCGNSIMQLSARTDLENIQAIVYQSQYQQAIKAQLDTVLAQLQSKEYSSIAEFLNQSYTNGFVGTMYDLKGQGIPLVVPIDQTAVAKAIQIDSKLSKNLYSKLGEDVNKLKTKVRAEVSRGIANGSSWNAIGTKIAGGMTSTAELFGFKQAQNNAIRIARTESHRIQSESALDAMTEAKKKGADLVKQWDATLDGDTREAHRMADGQIKELDEDFDVGGEKLKAPGIGGSASNVINCRCALLQRAKWALDKEELDTLKKRAEYFGLDKTKDFEEFKEKYLVITEEDVKLYDIRTLPDIKYVTTVQGVNEANVSWSIEKEINEDYESFKLKIDKGTKTELSDLPKETQIIARWHIGSDNSLQLKKGEYKNIQKYIEDSIELKQREEIAKALDAKYLGTDFAYRFRGRNWQVDYYEKEGRLLYSFGKADLKKNIEKDSLNDIIKIIEEREKIIGEKLAEKNIKFSQLKARQGNDWVDSMKEFHHIIRADELPTVISDSKYNTLNSPILYRGIAPQSHLRKDIKTNLSTQEMADGFYKDNRPFPSRGIYGDGIAYASPSKDTIAVQYATANGQITSGGKIIEFKLKEDANIISYEDAVDLFEQLSDMTNSNLLFAKNQRATEHEVGKAMNALGYDCIIKENGDNTGIPFYVVLNRGALVTKQDWITATISPSYLKGIKG